MTETVIPRPLREFYLAKDRRFERNGTFHFGQRRDIGDLQQDGGRTEGPDTSGPEGVRAATRRRIGKTNSPKV